MDICEINFNKDINEYYNSGHHKGGQICAIKN